MLMFLCSKQVSADSTFNVHYQKPNHIIVSHFQHPLIEPFNDFIRLVYQDIGITVEFMAVPAARGFQVVNNNVSDADTLRNSENANSYENLIIVAPTIALGELTLACRKTLDCSVDVLANKTAVILTTAGNLKSLEHENIQARIILGENATLNIHRLKKGRVDYVIIGTLKTWRVTDLSRTVNTVKLREFNVNHIIHKKHAPLVNELSMAIQMRLSHTKLQ